MERIKLMNQGTTVLYFNISFVDLLITQCVTYQYSKRTEEEIRVQQGGLIFPSHTTHQGPSSA